MATTPIAAGAGLRHIRYYLLDANGYPSGSQTGSNGYSGRRLEGAKSFAANIPDANVIRHTGDDRPFAQDQLPPTEFETATLTTGKTNLTADAELTNTLIEQIGTDIALYSTGTDKMGFENQIAMMAWRQALDVGDGDSNFGQRRYVTYVYHSAKIYPKGGSPQEGGADENSYNVVPTAVTAPAWGEQFTEEDNGYTTAIKSIITSENPLMMERFDGNGSIATFNLAFTPITAAKTHAWVNGVPATVNSVNTTNKTVTLSVAPASLSAVVLVYESSDIR